jgi:hypothetical protein
MSRQVLWKKEEDCRHGDRDRSDCEPYGRTNAPPSLVIVGQPRFRDLQEASGQLVECLGFLSNVIAREAIWKE